jgi:tetratricopeptide (TPR) repeat protein
MNAATPIETAERVDAAAQLVMAGRHAEAEALLRAILEREPRNPDAINTFASIALARRDGRRAYEILAPACTAYPDHARLMSNLGLAHMMLERSQEAVACLERAVATAPYDAEIRLSLAQFLTAAGDIPRAMQEIEAVLRQDPESVAALSQLGMASMGSGDVARAESAWRRAVAIDPKNADALHNLSVLCGSTGRHEEAALLAERAHLWAPFDIVKRVQFARSRASIGDFDGANAECKQVLMVAPENLPATELFARLTLIRGAVPAGLETLSHHVRRHPEDPGAILALAGALSFVEQALAVSPNHSFGQRLRQDILLTLGRFREAWPIAIPAPGNLPRRIVAPKGTSTIEALAFGRFISALDAEGVALTSFADEMVTGLLRQIQGVSLVEPDGASDMETLVLQSVPAALGVERATMAPADRFLDPDAEQAERWRKAFALLPRPLVGVDWDQFPPGAGADKMMLIAAGSGTVVSLAADPERRELVNWPKVVDAGAHIRGAADLVAAISCLDAIVATDGLPLHVAGALAIPGVALVACGYPWYFAADGNRSIWYRSLVVARQASPADWDSALSKASEALREILATPDRTSVQ